MSPIRRLCLSQSNNIVIIIISVIFVKLAHFFFSLVAMCSIAPVNGHNQRVDLIRQFIGKFRYQTRLGIKQADVAKAASLFDPVDDRREGEFAVGAIAVVVPAD